mmetsp:Transcript_19134/g.34648  ORF Transcript_19134/g.34648 Transcript_19134/m.34648 type:complete len:86 (+) Transcript_19134:324-581(+)
MLGLHTMTCPFINFLFAEGIYKISNFHLASFVKTNKEGLLPCREEPQAMNLHVRHDCDVHVATLFLLFASCILYTLLQPTFYIYT